MKIRTFALVAALVAFLFGLGFLIIPDTAMSLYGIELNESERFICRYLGSALLGTGVTWWIVRKAEDLAEAVAGVILGAITLSLTGLIVGLWDAIAGPANALTWINPVIYALLSIGFIYFYFKKEIK